MKSKMIVFIFVCFSSLCSVHGQNYLSFQPGIHFSFFNDSDNNHQTITYKGAPTLTFSTQFHLLIDSTSPVLGVAYKRFSFTKEETSGGLGCPGCFYEHTTTKINMLEFNISQKFYFFPSHLFFLRAGIFYSKTLFSSYEGTRQVTHIKQIPDTTLYYFLSETVEVDQKSPYQNEFGVIIGIGFDYPWKDDFSLHAGIDFKPSLSEDVRGSLCFRVGLNWMFMGRGEGKEVDEEMKFAGK